MAPDSLLHESGECGILSLKTGIPLKLENISKEQVA